MLTKKRGTTSTAVHYNQVRQKRSRRAPKKKRNRERIEKRRREREKSMDPRRTASDVQYISPPVSIP